MKLALMVVISNVLQRISVNHAAEELLSRYRPGPASLRRRKPTGRRLMQLSPDSNYELDSTRENVNSISAFPCQDMAAFWQALLHLSTVFESTDMQ